MNVIFLFKILSTPLLVLLSILAARRWGSFVGGCIAGLPTVSGPISLCLALEHGSSFAASVAYSALLGVGAVCLFTLAYAWTSMRHSWLVALLLAEVAYFSTGWLVGLLPHALPLAVTIGLAGPFTALLGMPRVPADIPTQPRPQAPWIVPTQMLLGAVLVYSITEAAATMGVHWSGILTFYPVMISILAPFCHASLGAYAARQLLAGLMTGFVGGTSFMTVILFGVEKLPIPVCYLLATALSLTLCTSVGLYQKRKRGA